MTDDQRMMVIERGVKAASMAADLVAAHLALPAEYARGITTLAPASTIATKTEALMAEMAGLLAAMTDATGEERERIAAAFDDVRRIWPRPGVLRNRGVEPSTPAHSAQ